MTVRRGLSLSPTVLWFSNHGDERDLQWLFRAVESHRRKYPHFTKSTLDKQKVSHVMVVNMHPHSEHVDLIICLTITAQARETRDLRDAVVGLLGS